MFLKEDRQPSQSFKGGSFSHAQRQVWPSDQHHTGQPSLSPLLWWSPPPTMMAEGRPRVMADRAPPVSLVCLSPVTTSLLLPAHGETYVTTTVPLRGVPRGSNKKMSMKCTVPGTQLASISTRETACSSFIPQHTAEQLQAPFLPHIQQTTRAAGKRIGSGLWTQKI